MRSAARGIAAFDDAPDRCGGVAHVHGLAVDMEAARDGFRCMLRRSAG